jgi:hypothetical protein
MHHPTRATARRSAHRLAYRLARASGAPAIALAVLLGALPALAGAALPGPVARDGYALQEVGSGRLKWLGFGIYDASLWSSDGRYVPRGPARGFEPGRTLALSLWYQRKFTREALIDITTREWDRLQLGTPEDRTRWAEALRRTWRDVARGDNLTAVVVPGAETRFYDEDRLLGRIPDPAFGPAFLSIWLDERSAVADLREELLGSNR